MAEAGVRKPTVVTEEESLSEVKVKVVIDGITAPMLGSKKQPKHGELFLKFSKCGFDLNVTLEKKGGADSKWAYSVKKLPSEIDETKSTWKVDKGLVVITLIKTAAVSWVPQLRKGLEQYESDSEED